MVKHNVSQPKKEKLVKWYGWIIILLLCVTPLVIIILPKLMLNVGRINKILRESQIPETDSINGEVLEVQWNRIVDGDIICIEGQMLIDTKERGQINTVFRKYVGPKYNETIDVSLKDPVGLTGKYEEDIFLVRSIRNLDTKQIYDTAPLVSVY
ncbi:hypothetical protein [Desulforamulus aeronauticus]|uniref:Uncharacterized protein n=1 Tax=Desulforamulus aeronauticus DSM 10349 TaxID=1121421 RepID=A0A1M6UNN5_9FIRM|nr:hypothetical protein [Desulforamulus aeronauticus]SHK70733.1 hypothetical protein SAMN02745123_02840 [Desulforamulus aeronauticus DSM 10349]